MTSEVEQPPGEGAPRTAPIARALDQSQDVQGKVEQAAADLSSVNAVLKDDIVEGVPIVHIEQTLNQSEALKITVQEAAAELVVVNDASAAEIAQRNALENTGAKSDAPLTESRASERRARHSTLHDASTGLPHSTLFKDRLSNALEQAVRHGWRLAVMFIDLDEFKLVNDTHGHQVGDVVPQKVAQRLHSVVRRGDTISRRSGDDFLFLMLEAEDDSSVAAFSARIVDILCHPRVFPSSVCSRKQ